MKMAIPFKQLLAIVRPMHMKKETIAFQLLMFATCIWWFIYWPVGAAFECVLLLFMWRCLRQPNA